MGGTRTSEFAYEHLEGLPYGLLEIDAGGRIIELTAVLDALHVLPFGP